MCEWEPVHTNPPTTCPAPAVVAVEFESLWGMEVMGLCAEHHGEFLVGCAEANMPSVTHALVGNTL